VELWRVTSNADNRYVYGAAEGFGHALASHIVAQAFKILRVSASLSTGPLWWSLHEAPNLIEFEFDHGVEMERYSYNGRCLAEVRRRKKMIRGELNGHSDFFVPVLARGELVATLVVGQVALSRPTAAKIVERWRAISGRDGHLGDPEFADYLSKTLSLLVLEGDQRSAFERLLLCFARLIAGEGKADELANQADALRVELEPVRLVDRVGQVITEMVDEQRTSRWSSDSHAFELRQLGLSRPPDHVLVGLCTSRTPESDPVDEVVRRDAFQRNAAALARKKGDAISGAVGEHGVVLLSGAGRGATLRKQKVEELAQRASTLARQRFGLSVHWGACPVSGTVPLSRSYQAALAAAELSVARASQIEFADPHSEPGPESLRGLRDDLARLPEEHPELILPRFERYLYAVAAHSGDRIEPARAHLEIGFELLGKGLVASGALDQKTFGALLSGLERSSRTVPTAGELHAIYRRAVRHTLEAIQRTAPRHEGSLRKAVEYVRHHYTEPINFSRAAKIAGFAPGYFSQLFRKQEGVSFEKYVRALRLEHAKRLLTSTEIAVAKVAALSGFSSPQYFCRVFACDVGVSPREYRQRPRTSLNRGQANTK
jgi:AraC-like DNA-binding protein